MSNFSIEKKGYNIDQVDAYIDDLEAKYMRLQSQNAELEQKLATAKRLIRRFSDTENALKQNIADSKRAAAYMISDAKERSSALLDETRESCGEIISDLDMQISERMNTVDVMKAAISTFRDELFNLYSSHIELIDTLAETAENFTYDPNYTPVAEAVDRFEEGGEPECEVPDFVEYPDESIFAELEEEENEKENFNITIEEILSDEEEDLAFSSFAAISEDENVEDEDFSQLILEAEENIVLDNSEEEVEFDLSEEVLAEDEEEILDEEVVKTDYFKFLSDFANSEDNTEN